MLDIKKIKQMLENGATVKLECVDIEGLLRKNKHTSKHWKNEVEKGIIKVLEVDEVCGRISFADPSNVVAFLLYEDLKHFRIAEDKPTFDDLIDVAVQAYKDGVIKSLKLIDYGVHSLSYSVNADANGDENTIFSQHKDYSDGINFINSLYTETFVIETVDDYLKINNTSEIKINENFIVKGEKVLSDVKSVRAKLERSGILLDDNFYFDMLSWLLKGATVTQKRGK